MITFSVLLVYVQEASFKYNINFIILNSIMILIHNMIHMIHNNEFNNEFNNNFIFHIDDFVFLNDK